MSEGAVTLAGFSVVPFDTPTATIRERLATFPQFTQYTKQVDAALVIMDKCRRWLTDDTAPTLCSAAFRQNDAIYQIVAFYSPDRLADQVRQAAALDSASDIQAIAAFALACTLRALCALGDCLTGTAVDEIAALELFRLHLEAIVECIPGAGAWLDSDECAACAELGDLAADAAKQADFKADGIWSGMVRRGQDGTAARDLAICKKALELIRSGTRFHNLSSKLRDWQQRENGEALSKPAMDAVLQRWGLTLSTQPVNPKKK